MNTYCTAIRSTGDPFGRARSEGSFVRGDEDNAVKAL